MFIGVIEETRTVDPPRGMCTPSRRVRTVHARVIIVSGPFTGVRNARFRSPARLEFRFGARTCTTFATPPSPPVGGGRAAYLDRGNGNRTAGAVYDGAERERTF